MNQCNYTDINENNIYNLLLCLAPPEGEYETEYKLSNNIYIIINKSGIFIKQIVSDEFLPYIKTIMRKIDPRSLETYGINKNKLYILLCNNIYNLFYAARNGSLYAKNIIEKYRNIIEKIDC